MNATNIILHKNTGELSLSEQLKIEKSRLFSKPKKSMLKKPAEYAKDEVGIQHFVKRSKQFYISYGYPRTAQHDIRIFMIYLCQQYKIEVDDFLGKNRKAPKPLARKMFAFFAYYYFGLTHEDISKLMNKERSTITTHIPDFINELQIYPSVRDVALLCDVYLFQLLQRKKKNAV